MDTDFELIIGFTQEACDYLDEVEPALIELSQETSSEGDTDPELINGVFRLFHSMKGSAGFLQLNTVAKVTHEAETLLDKIRKGKTTLSHEITQLLCRTLDFFREMLASIEENGHDNGFEEQSAEFIVLLQAAAGNAGDTPAKEVKKATKKAKKKVIKKEPEVKADVFQKVEISDEMRKGFVQEGIEQVDTTEHSLLALEGDDAEKGEILNEAFRNIHSFKGNCGFMGFIDLERISHKMETALDLMRNGMIESDSGNVGVLLSMIDVLRDTVNVIGGNGDDSVSAADIYLEIISEMIPADEEEEYEEVVVEEEEEVEAVEVEEEEIEAEEDEKAVEQEIEKAPPSTAAPAVKAATPAAKAPERAKKATRQDIRVDLLKLDNLINLVGELVIAESMVTRSPIVASIDDEQFFRSVHQLRRICDDLQDVAMSVRMIPLSGTFRKMIRLVHDLSHKAGKKIKLNIVGEETEVDKTVIEQIADPLVHIVRNSCDHGIATPEEREKSGKPGMGTVTIEGRHEGGEVWILITDDGRGLNKEVILKKAIERGLVQGDGSELSDERIFRMVFEPGFSTAEKVTDISGRGVGMDVVKRNIEKLNGRIDITSELGKGSTFILRIPLTLAIIDGMLVRVGSTKYTIPVLSIRESIRPALKDITITPDGGEVLRLRDELIPVVRMHDVFSMHPDSSKLEEGILVIVEDAGALVAVFIDEIVGQQQTVIKGLSGYIGHARGCSGCTILGDGSVSLILDISSLVSMAEEFSHSHTASDIMKAHATEEVATESQIASEPEAVVVVEAEEDASDVEADVVSDIDLS